MEEIDYDYEGDNEVLEAAEFFEAGDYAPGFWGDED